MLNCISLSDPNLRHIFSPQLLLDRVDPPQSERAVGCVRWCRPQPRGTECRADRLGREIMVMRGTDSNRSESRAPADQRTERQTAE